MTYSDLHSDAELVDAEMKSADETPTLAYIHIDTHPELTESQKEQYITQTQQQYYRYQQQQQTQLQAAFIPPQQTGRRTLAPHNDWYCDHESRGPSVMGLAFAPIRLVRRVVFGTGTMCRWCRRQQRREYRRQRRFGYY